MTFSMNKDAILDALRQNPDSETEKLIHLRDGRTLHVPHPDMVVFPGPRGPAVGVFFKATGGFEVFSLEHVVGVSVPPPPHDEID